MSIRALLTVVDIMATNLHSFHPEASVNSFPVLAPAQGASRHLLVPLRARQDARHAVRYARELKGKGFSVTITWLCVVSEDVVLHQFDGDDHVLTDEYRAAYLLTGATMLIEDMQISSSSLIRYGESVFNILDCADEVCCDEIVLYAASQPALPSELIRHQRLTGAPRIALVLLKNPARVRSGRGVWRFWMRALGRELRKAATVVFAQLSAKLPVLARLQRQ
jgi:hypothetical protein